jgi:hypothetical protein
MALCNTNLLINNQELQEVVTPILPFLFFPPQIVLGLTNTF